jgi:hypothetical protein
MSTAISEILTVMTVKNCQNVIPWRWRQQVPPNQSAEKSDAKLSLLTQKLTQHL